jgi:hypothetical protein
MIVGSRYAGATVKFETEPWLLEGWWFNPWQDNFTHFIISIYK